MSEQCLAECGNQIYGNKIQNEVCDELIKISWLYITALSQEMISHLGTVR